MSKKKKTALIIAGLILLVAICCVCVGAYAKTIINKPKFKVPESTPAASAEKIPEDGKEKADYFACLYNAAFTDETEVSRRYEISIDDGSIESSASEADTAVMKLAKDSLLGFVRDSRQVPEDYRSSFAFDVENMGEVLIEQGRTDDAGNVSDEDYYFFDMKDISVSDTDEDFEPVIKNAVEALKTELADVAEITDWSVTPESSSVSGKADRIRNHLVYAEFRRYYSAEFALSFKGEYAPLGEVKLSFDFSAEDIYDFKWYGAYFTEKALYLNPDDSKTLPLSTYVAEGTDSKGFKLSFDLSEEGVVSVDESGNLEALAASEKPVEITMTFEYKGRTYKDTCFVTVTDLEVETNG